jgi:hypothetical protein
MGMCNCNGSCRNGGGCGGAGPGYPQMGVGVAPPVVDDNNYQPPYDTSGAPNPYYYPNGFYYPPYNPWAPWQGYPPCGGCCRCRGWMPMPYWHGGMAVAQGGVGVCQSNGLPAAMGTYGPLPNVSSVTINNPGPVTTGVVEVDPTKVDPNVSFYTKL